MSVIVAATGHRPDKLGGYGLAESDRRKGIARSALILLGAHEVIVGMALGWDSDVCRAALELGLVVPAAVPFHGPESRWPQQSRQEYQRLLGQCSSVTTVCPGGYSAAAMHIRNQWMVDRAPWVLALWDGSPGGTSNCVRYALAQGRHVVNVWGLHIDPADNFRLESAQIGG